MLNLSKVVNLIEAYEISQDGMDERHALYVYLRDNAEGRIVVHQNKGYRVIVGRTMEVFEHVFVTGG